MEVNLLSTLVFFSVSFVAAAINSVAIGETFLTFPVFILNGLTAAQANIMSATPSGPACSPAAKAIARSSGNRRNC